MLSTYQDRIYNVAEWVGLTVIFNEKITKTKHFQNSAKRAQIP